MNDRCPECGWATISGRDTNPNFPIHLRWLAVRPAQPPGTSQVWREDMEWFRDHPETDERIRPLSVDEQMRAFCYGGSA